MPFLSDLKLESEYYLNSLQRISLIEEFLAKAGFDIFEFSVLQSDASKRRYLRVYHNKKSYILMDSSEELQTVKPFYKIANFLIEENFSVPEIFEVDFEKGFILLEDFGDNLISNHLNHNIVDENEIYKLAVDVLLKVRSLPLLNNAPSFSKQVMQIGLTTFVDWYGIKHIKKEKVQKAKDELLKIFSNLYDANLSNEKVLVLRDYMADNLFYLPERNGINKIGLIDFQDASIGHPAYDLVSLLEDARRDVSLEISIGMLEHYILKVSDINAEKFKKAYFIISMQRNLRIIGVFHRLVQLYGKKKYAAYLPRVWRYIERTLDIEVVREIKEWFVKYEVPLG